MKKKIDIQVFRDFLKKSNNNFSVEREALFEVMLSMKGHYSALGEYQVSGIIFLF